jgi:L-lactate dehydrogenase (cytochrome)
MYLYALAAAGQAGVEKALGNLQSEIERGMKLMGVSALNQLTPDMIRHRQV